MLDKPTHLIRPARRAELAEISTVIAAAFARFRGEAPDQILDLYIAESVAIETQWEHGDVVVLESHGRIAGNVVYYRNASEQGLGLPEGWAGLRTLAVDPQARGHGFGRALVEHAVRRARDDGARTIGLHTADFMKTAVGLYRRTGFVRCPEHDLMASSILGFDAKAGDVLVTAYRCLL